MTRTLNVLECLKLEYDTIDKEEVAVESHASPSQLRELAASPAWQDIKTHLKLAIMAFRDELEVAGQDIPREETAYTQGQAFRCRIMLEMPEFLATEKERELEDGEERE